MVSQSTTKDWLVTEDKVSVALQRLIDAADPSKIIAFGSRAKGIARKDSDLDLAVILDPASSKKPGTFLWSLFSDLHLPVDLIVVDEPQHTRLSASVNSVHHAIAHDGILLYQRNGDGSADRSALKKISR